jgi:3-oxoadipate enol-lactonase
VIVGIVPERRSRRKGPKVAHAAELGDVGGRDDTSRATMTEFSHIGPAPRIAVEYAGQGPLVMLLHGIGGNRDNWRDQIPVLAGHFRVAAWDARGYGDSDDYDGPLSFADVSRDLIRVLDHFGATRAHLVGLSMGGRIAQEFTALFPERVATLTLCDTHASFKDFPPETQRSFVSLRLKPLVEEGKSPADIAPRVARSLMGPNATDAMVERLIASVAKLHKESYMKTVKSTVDFDRRDDLKRIPAPTLVLNGEHDRLTPPAMARDLAAQIPGSRVEIVADAGHLINIEQPDVFNRLVLDFLLVHRDRAY